MERSTFSIRWNHHQNHLLTSINYALINKSFVDVTILCANPHPEVGGPVLNTWTFNAHKVSLEIVLTKVFGHFWFLFVLVGPFGMLAIFRKSASWQCSFRTKSNRFAKGYTASRFFSFVEIHVPRYKVDFTKIKYKFKCQLSTIANLCRTSRGSERRLGQRTQSRTSFKNRRPN